MSKHSVRLLLCSLAFLSFSEGAEEACQDGPRPYRVSLRHIEGNGIGYRQGYTTLDGFFAWDKMERFVPFLDVRGHVFNDGKFAANAGIGGRYLVPSLARNFGANVYYDYRNTTHQHYNQVGGGFETLGTHWDFRLNGYFPVGKRTSHFFSTNFDKFQGHYALLKRKQEFDMTGFDAEAGYHIKVYKDYPIYAAAGPYYISGKFGENSWGVETRLSVGYKQYVKLEGSFSYDSIFRDIWQGQVTLSLPFGKGHKLKKGTERADRSCQEAYLVRESLLQDVNRKEIIVVDRHKVRQRAIDPATGSPYFFLFVDNTSHSAGTFESPFPTLAQAQAASGPNNIIYVFPGDGTTTGMNAGIVLQDSQRLLGASIDHKLTTTLGTFTLPAEASSLPVISNLSGDVVAIANNNEISGFYIQNNNGNGISQSNAAISVANLTVSNNTIAGLGNEGIHLNNMAGTLTIKDNLINQKNASLVHVTNTNVNNANYAIANNQLTAADACVLLTFTDSSGIATTISGNHFNGNDDGILITSNNAALANANTFNIDNNTFNTNGSFVAGLFNGFSNTGISVVNNQGFTSDGDGVFASLQNSAQVALNVTENTLTCFEAVIAIELEDSSTSTGSISGNTMVSKVSPTILVTLDNTAATTYSIANNQIESEAVEPGILVQTATTATSACTISNNSFVGNIIGVALEADDSSIQTASITGNTITGSQQAGIELTTNATSTGAWEVSRNTFNANLTGAAIITANDTSTTCLEFVNNSAVPITGAYQFTNSGAIFNLEPLVGNTGQVIETGVIDDVPKGTCGLIVD